MKYPSLKKENQSVFDIKTLNGGINRDTVPQHIGDTQIAHGKNIWYKNGGLQSRKGISFSQDESMYPYSSFCKTEDFVFTDNTVLIDGRVNKIAYAIFCDGEADAEIQTAFIDTDGKVTFANSLYFFRFDWENFYIPKAVNFFNTKNEQGKDTLFMTVLRENERGELNTEVYEQISAAGLSWMLVSDKNYYAPIVLMDGQGNNYLTAVDMGAVDRFTPYNPESMNLFTGWCRSYFTCDGYSHQFKTPCSKFDSNSSVYVVYHGTGEKLSWELPAGVSSIEVTVLNETVKLNCNRSNGSIAFAKGSAPYPLPVYYECSNNLLVTALSGDSTDLIDKVASSKGNLCYNSKAFFYNNRFEENEICYMDLRKSFYAPEQASVKVGNGGFPVTAVKELGGKVFAFKPDEIYTVDINYGKQAEYYIFPLSLDEKLFYSDTLSTKCVNNRVGCALPKTLVTLSKTALWLGMDKTVYQMDTSGKVENTADISSVLCEFGVDALKRASACIYEEHYALCIDSKIILVNYEDKSYYQWELPQGTNCMAAVKTSGGLLLGLVNKDNNCAYFSRPCEDSDTIIEEILSDTLGNRTFITNKQRIPSQILSKAYDLNSPNTRKVFESVIMNIAAKNGFFITFNGGNRRFVTAKEQLSQIKLLPHLKPHRDIEFKIEADGILELCDIRIKYRTVDNKF